MTTPQLKPTQNESFWDGDPFVVSGVVDVHKSECDQEVAVVEARVLNVQVWTISGPLAHITEIVADIPRGRYSEEEATTARRRSSRRNRLPSNI